MQYLSPMTYSIDEQADMYRCPQVAQIMIQVYNIDQCNLRARRESIIYAPFPLTISHGIKLM